MITNTKVESFAIVRGDCFTVLNGLTFPGEGGLHTEVHYTL